MFVSYEDIVNRWTSGEPYPISQTVTETLIEDAEALILREFPTLAARIANGELAISLVKQVVARMIKGYVINGNGLTQHSQTVGPYSNSESYSSRTTRYELMLTANDRAILAPAIITTVGSIETIDSYVNYHNARGAITGEDYANGWRFYSRDAL